MRHNHIVIYPLQFRQRNVINLPMLSIHKTVMPLFGNEYPITFTSGQGIIMLGRNNTYKNICLNPLTHIFICVIVVLSGGQYMKSYSSREVIQMLKADGWYEVNVVGSHLQFKHPTKKRRTTENILTKIFPLKH